MSPAWRPILLCVGLVSFSAFSQGFKRTLVENSKVCTAWSQREITYQVDAAGARKIPQNAEFQAITASFASWQMLSDRCSDFKFLEGPNIADFKVGKVPGSSSNNVITFREQKCEIPQVPEQDPCRADDSCGNTYKCWQHAADALALTTTTYNVSRGIITDADIELNSASWFFTTVESPKCSESNQTINCVANDLQNTMTHEIGHAVGFDHVADSKSTMWRSAPLGEVSKRKIDDGTANGFCLTYPKGLPPTSCEDMSDSRLQITATGMGTPGLQGIGCSNTRGLCWAASGLWVWLFFRRRIGRM